MTESQPTVVRADFSLAMDIFLDGLTTGISSALASFAGQQSEQARDAITDDMVRAMKADPAVMETLRIAVRERLLGQDSGPKNLSVRGGGR